jgi:catechol 2,3-dioxygenase-like lactoylglutathione lyase family enzyme
MATRWEYKVAYVEPWDRVSIEGNETHREERERDSAFGRRFLNGMGADGWELIGIQHGWRGNAYYIFKRELPEGAEPDLTVVKRAASEEERQPPPPATPPGPDMV